MRHRGRLLAHIQNTNHQCNHDDFGVTLTYKVNREGVAERFDDASMRKSVEVDLALIANYDEIIRDLELYIVRMAKQHDADMFHRLRSIIRLVCTPGEMPSGIRRQTHGDRRRQDRQRASQMGLLRSSRAVSQEEPQGPAIPGASDQEARQRKSAEHPGPQLGRATFYVMKRSRNFDEDKFLAA